MTQQSHFVGRPEGMGVPVGSRLSHRRHVKGIGQEHAQVPDRHQLDSSPAEYVASVRFAFARDELDAGYTVTEAAMAAGYGSIEAMRRAFVARLGVSPRKYQRRFRSAVPVS